MRINTLTLTQIVLTPPYYIVPLVEEYKKLDPVSERAKELGRLLAANIGDYASLRLVLGIDPPEFGRFYPDMETATPSTFDTIDSFLDKFGSGLPSGGYMPGDDLSESTARGDEQTEVGGSTEIREKEEPEEAETLSGLLRNHRYEEAIVLIEGQNLNNPQKSIYFAHQIRFLKKLISLDKYRNKNQG